MSMRTKYKLGERVLFNNGDGLETLATITGITNEITSEGCKTIYKSNKIIFEESQILGRVFVQKPRSRAKKKIAELKAMSNGLTAATA